MLSASESAARDGDGLVRKQVTKRISWRARRRAGRRVCVKIVRPGPVVTVRGLLLVRREEATTGERGEREESHGSRNEGGRDMFSQGGRVKLEVEAKAGWMMMM